MRGQEHKKGETEGDEGDDEEVVRGYRAAVEDEVDEKDGEEFACFAEDDGRVGEVFECCEAQGGRDG